MATSGGSTLWKPSISGAFSLQLNNIKNNIKHTVKTQLSQICGRSTNNSDNQGVWINEGMSLCVPNSGQF